MSSVSLDLEGAGFISPDSEGVGSIMADLEGTGSISLDPSKGDSTLPDGGPYHLQPLRV